MTEETARLLMHEVEEAVPKMRAALDEAIEGQQRLRADIDARLREAGLLDAERVREQ